MQTRRLGTAPPSTRAPSSPGSLPRPPAPPPRSPIHRPHTAVSSPARAPTRRPRLAVPPTSRARLVLAVRLRDLNRPRGKQVSPAHPRRQSASSHAPWSAVPRPASLRPWPVSPARKPCQRASCRPSTWPAPPGSSPAFRTGCAAPAATQVGTAGTPRGPALSGYCDPVMSRKGVPARFTTP